MGNDNPMKELNDVADKQVIEDQREKETSGVSVSVIPLNNAMVTNDDNSEIPTKSKRLRKAPIARSKDFLW